MRAWVDVATLVNTKNLNGGLVARAASGLPFLLSEGDQVALVPPVLDAPRNVRVAEVSLRAEDEAVVFFEGVPDADTAEMLVGCHCLMRRNEVDLDFIEADADLPAWEGWQVFDEVAGYVGSVAAVEDRLYQPLLVVAREGAGDVLVPLVEDFIVEIDEDARTIRLDCPRGLFEL